MTVFVTGTDTGCGKTFICAESLRGAASTGLRVVGMKPIASGAEWIDGRLWNEDVDALSRASNVTLAPEVVNPYLFEPPASPHIAAGSATTVEITRIRAAYDACMSAADFVIVEGVGGWLVPINATQTVADLAAALELPIVLVVGIRLGCINHALLSAAAITAHGSALCGWVANVLEPDLYGRTEVIATLTSRIPAPLLGVVDWCDAGSAQAIGRRLAEALRS